MFTPRLTPVILKTQNMFRQLINVEKLILHFFFKKQTELPFNAFLWPSTFICINRSVNPEFLLHKMQKIH